VFEHHFLKKPTQFTVLTILGKKEIWEWKITYIWVCFFYKPIMWIRNHKTFGLLFMDLVIPTVEWRELYKYLWICILKSFFVFNTIKLPQTVLKRG